MGPAPAVCASPRIISSPRLFNTFQFSYSPGAGHHFRLLSFMAAPTDLILTVSNSDTSVAFTGDWQRDTQDGTVNSDNPSDISSVALTFHGELFPHTTLYTSCNLCSPHS